MKRAAFLAGSWYPDEDGACRAAIERHAAETTPEQDAWRGAIAPHAGWIYSGDAAARTLRWLAGARPNADLVVVFGSHRGPRGPNTIFCETEWETPLGSLLTAHDLAATLRDQLLLDEEPAEPRRPDNAVEVLLPFVRYFFPRAELLMLGVEAGDRAIAIGEAVASAVRDAKRDAVVLGSTDLTHYGPNYDFSPRGAGVDAVNWVRNDNDRGFINHVLQGDAQGVIAHAQLHSSACCPGAVAAALVTARALGAASSARLVEHYLSFDVQPASSFVGYAGVIF